MNTETRQALIDTSWDMHSKVEENYLANLAKKGDPQWLEKQRLLLADMALHLLQTALKPDDIDTSTLANNVHAILTISDHFLPHAELREATKKLYKDAP